VPEPHAPNTLPVVAAFAAAGAFTLTPWATPALALGLGAALALTLGNPAPARTAGAAKWLLQGAIVGLGFGIPIDVVAKAGGAGLLLTLFSIATALTAGLLLGRWLGVDRDTSVLITAGTSICGGSAIAAVGRVIGARPDAMSVSLATVFVLNGVALYLFPPVAHWLDLSQHQFAVWAAIAIHDTSSVVGAAASYGPLALEEATILKLARTLWIIPVAMLAALWAGRSRHGGGTAVRPQMPAFIGLFVAASVARTAMPSMSAMFDSVAAVARVALVATLFLIGAGMTRTVFRAVGIKPLVQGVALWSLLGSVTLGAVLVFVGR